MRAREIAAESFTSLELMRFDQGAAIASAPTREPGQRTFRFIDDDAGSAELCDDLPRRQSQMLSPKAVVAASGLETSDACDDVLSGGAGIAAVARRRSLGKLLRRIIYLRRYKKESPR